MIRVVYLSCNIKLRSLYIKLHCCLNLNGNLKYLWKPFSSVLIIVSMNLFDKLVIVTCDPVMEGLNSLRKGIGVLIFFFVFFKFKLWVEDWIDLVKS